MCKGRVLRAAAAVRRRGARLLRETPGSGRRPAKPPWHPKRCSRGHAFHESAATPTTRAAASPGHFRSGSNRQRASARSRREKPQFPYDTAGGNPAAAGALLAATMGAACRLQARPKLGRPPGAGARAILLLATARLSISSGLRRGSGPANDPTFCASVRRSTGCTPILRTGWAGSARNCLREKVSSSSMTRRITAISRNRATPTRRP